MNFSTVVPASFPTTQWGMILAAAGEPDCSAARAALETLYRTYWPPIFGFVRRQGYSASDAEDLTQDFFLYLLDQHACAKADRHQGKFRSFLLAWLRNFLGTVATREGRLKRGGGQTRIALDDTTHILDRFEAESLTASAPLDEEQCFDWLWASELVRQAMDTITAEYAEAERSPIFDALKPFLLGGVGLPDQQETAQHLGMPVETLRSHISRLRARYRKVLREEVMRTIHEGADVDEELRYLGRVLVAAQAPLS
jgi:RNA polymerase sigma-70 factor (ECF subfamily)